MNKTKKEKVVLCLFPNTIGICYAVFIGIKLIDYGIGYVSPVSNKKSLNRVMQYINFHNPDVILLRKLSKPKAVLNKRNKELINAITEVINSKQRIVLETYTRNKIQEVFQLFQVFSKYQISQKLIYWFPQLAGYEYPFRKDFMSENHNTGVFSAVSLAVVYFHDNEYYYDQ